jgi:hypothetical protein
MAKENLKKSKETNDIIREAEEDMKKMLFEKYEYLQSKYDEKDLSVDWDSLEHLQDNTDGKDVLHIMTIPVIKVSDNKPIGLLALKFKSNGPKGKIFASTLQFIPMN